jgi:DNA-binding SARP family transcriptional activator
VADPGDVKLEVLGGFRVRLASTTVDERDWPGRRPMELVQLLALSPSHSLARDQVIDVLWPHLDAEAGAANLRKAAHHARQVLGDPDAVVLRGGRVHLFPERAVSTDLEQFETLTAAALRTGDAAMCATAAQQYGGELLPGTRYEDWAEEARRHARARYVELLRAGEQWEQLVTAEPTDEEAYRRLMQAALDGGLRPAAIRWYGKARAALAAELGVSPSAATEELYDRAIDGLAARPVTIVGREVELAQATSALREAAELRLGALRVRGPAGIGKSALCGEIASIARAEGRSVWWATASEPEAAYAPIVAIVDEALLGARVRLAAVPPQLQAVLATLTAGAAPAPPPDGPVSRHQVMGALCRLLRACGEGGETVIVLDDAHLADTATLDVLLHVASSVPDFLVVLAYREHPVNPTLARGTARLDRAHRIVTIDLDPLDAGAASELARHAAGRNLDRQVLVRVVEQGAGNPFMIEELARHATIEVGDLPRDVSDAIASRFVELDEDAMAVLQRFALMGDDIDTGAVVALARDSEASTYAALDRALDAGVLVVTGGRYRFRHGLVRQALVDRMSPHAHLVFHHEIAERLTAVRAPAATIARHWLAAGEPERAVPWLLTAAHRAMEVGAFTEARHHASAVLDHDDRHAAALRVYAEAMDMAGDPAALGAYDAAIEVAAADEVGDLVAMRALAQVKQGDPSGGLAAIAGAEPTTVLGRLSEALTYAGAAALGATDPAIGTLKAAECRRLALESGDRAAIVIASWAQAAAAHARGELRDSVLADLRDTKDLPHLAVRVFDGHLCITQRLLYGARPYADVITFADGLAAEARRLHAARGQAFGMTLRGEAELLSGQLDAAAADLHTAVGLHRATAGATGEAHSLQRLAEVALHQGRRDAARSLVDEALDLARVTDIGFHLLDRIYGTRIAMAADPREALAALDEAEEAVRGPLETCPGCRITFAVPAAIACANAGELDRAAAYVDASEYLAHVVMRLPAWDAAYEEVLAHVARASRDHAGSRARFAAAADGFAAAGQPLDEARCRALAALD